MTRLPLEKPHHPPDFDAIVLLNALARAVKGFWRFSQFHGEYQSTPVWERHAKLKKLAAEEKK